LAAGEGRRAHIRARTHTHVRVRASAKMAPHIVQMDDPAQGERPDGASFAHEPLAHVPLTNRSGFPTSIGLDREGEGSPEKQTPVLPRRSWVLGGAWGAAT